MNAFWAVIIAVAFGLAVAVPFYAITMHLNKKNWAWEESGKYLRDMNRASLWISIVMFLFMGLFGFIAVGLAVGVTP